MNNPFAVTELYLRPFPELMKKCLPEAQEVQPDYIIHDTAAPWGALIAELLHLPSVGLQTVLLVKTEMLRFYPRQAARAFSLYMAARKETRSIAYTSRTFQPMEHLFPENYVFIGPSIRDRGEHLDFPLDRLGDRPIIYISLGTIFNNRLAFYRTCIEAFADGKYQVVLAVGSHVQLEDLGQIPENFLVDQYVPQLEILSRAALFISHGGLNSVLEALWYGVPMLLFPPKSNDQPWVAECVEKAGAGKSYSKPHITASKLRALAERVLAKPDYAQASKRIGESLHTAGGVSKAADAIEELKRRKNIGQTDAPDVQKLRS
jgi:MGT family glycosyltransferase